VSLVVEDVAYLLEQGGIATRSGGDARTILIGAKAKPPAAIAWFVRLVEYGGLLEHTHDRSTAAYHLPKVQVAFTSNDWLLIRQKAHEALGVLDIGNVEVNGTWYRRLSPMQSPFDMGIDDNQRAKFGFNVQAEKRP
jgi:hypothetical protein